MKGRLDTNWNLASDESWVRPSPLAANEGPVPQAFCVGDISNLKRTDGWPYRDSLDDGVQHIKASATNSARSSELPVTGVDAAESIGERGVTESLTDTVVIAAQPRRVLRLVSTAP